MHVPSKPDPKYNNGDIVKEEGTPIEAREFDENQLKLVKAGQFVGNHETGGPRPRVSER